MRGIVEVLLTGNSAVLPAHYFFTNLFFRLKTTNFITKQTKNKKIKKIFNGGYLGSHFDEERSEVR